MGIRSRSLIWLAVDLLRPGRRHHHLVHSPGDHGPRMKSLDTTACKSKVGHGGIDAVTLEDALAFSSSLLPLDLFLHSFSKCLGITCFCVPSAILVPANKPGELSAQRPYQWEKQTMNQDANKRMKRISSCVVQHGRESSKDEQTELAPL